MSTKIAADHLARGAVVYVRQSTMTQVQGNLESQKRQYALADAARAAGFVSVTVIDDDLGRSGSGLAARPASSAWLPNSAPVPLAPCSASRHRGWRAMGATGTIWSISVP